MLSSRNMAIGHQRIMADITVRDHLLRALSEAHLFESLNNSRVFGNWLAFATSSAAGLWSIRCEHVSAPHNKTISRTNLCEFKRGACSMTVFSL